MSGPSKSARAGDDVYVLDEVQPGEWLLVLSAGELGRWILIDRMRVRVSEGENPIEWVLTPLYEVTLEPAAKEEPVRFGLARIDPAGNWMHQFASSSEGGDAVFRFVPAGRYELTGRYAGEDRRIAIDVPGQTHVRLE